MEAGGGVLGAGLGQAVGLVFGLGVGGVAHGSIHCRLFTTLKTVVVHASNRLAMAAFVSPAAYAARIARTVAQLCFALACAAPGGLRRDCSAHVATLDPLLVVNDLEHGSRVDAVPPRDVSVFRALGPVAADLAGDGPGDASAWRWRSARRRPGGGAWAAGTLGGSCADCANSAPIPGYRDWGLRQFRGGL
jgi:hypothetical protein